MWGRLTLDAIPKDPVTLSAVVGGGLGILVIVGLLTYYKKWGYLWKNWFTSLDAKKIGIMYLVVSFIMLLRALSDAVMIRAQQAIFATDPSSSPISPELFQQVFTAHGTIMIFFVAMGIIFGVINIIMPLQIGARDVAFPFMNSVSFWLFFAGMTLMNISLGFGEFSAAGWLAYPPLSGIEYSPGTGVDYWIWSLQLSGIGSLLSGINFLVTIYKMRRPGMTPMMMPIFVWSVVGAMLLVCAVFPILTATLSMLALDRIFDMHFFTSDLGGNPMLYVNLIWAWGHPEVYILVLPAFGIFSEVVMTFSRKRLFGYTSMVYAVMAIAFFSYAVWLHHFFTMGAGANVNAFFGIMTMIIGIPTGVKIFNWLFTMYRGRVTFTVPMLWFVAFVVTFTIGGVTGVMLAVPAIDFVVHNSLFLVAHFHNVIIGGVVFGAFAGYTYWFPKLTGIKLHEGLGKASVWMWTVGFFLAFMPLYLLGFMGAVRRMDHYDPSLGWQGLFIVSGVGVMVILLGVGFQVLQTAYSVWRFRKGDKEYVAGPDPWDGRTLEWSTSTPIAEYNFATMTPVKERDAYWEIKQSHEKIPEKTEDIVLPKNTGYGVFIAAAAFVAGFAIIWHVWWVAVLGVVAAIILVIAATLREDTEYTITAKEVLATEKKLRRLKV